MKRQTAIFFYILSAYVVIQFLWWGYHILELSKLTAETDVVMKKRVTMIIGEALVFFPILFLGFWKIRHAIKKEIDLNKRQSNFLLSVTHELKTPIASTRLYLQTVLKRKSLEEEKRSELLQKALQENARLESLIENILTASRIENHKVEVFKESVDLELELQRIKATFVVEESQIEIRNSVSGNIQLDKFIFETILTNLIDNAIKYSPASSPIEICAVKQGQNLVLEVKDLGVGIPESKRKDIFKQFVRIGSEETRTQKGSGIGLFLVAEFVKLHDGSVEVVSNGNKGSIFKITLNNV